VGSQPDGINDQLKKSEQLAKASLESGVTEFVLQTICFLIFAMTKNKIFGIYKSGSKYLQSSPHHKRRNRDMKKIFAWLFLLNTFIFSEVLIISSG
jgi:hypothetical protein